MTASDPQRRRDRGRQDKGRSERGDGRELALLALCHLESYDASERADALTIFWADPPGVGGDDDDDDDDPSAAAVDAAPLARWIADAAIRGFAEELLGAVLGGGAGIDETIEATSRSWRIARMDRVDRNILRMVAAELTSVPATPRGVILAEAVRLASRYGSDRSAPFVNGLAESLARRLRPEGRGA